MRVGLSQGLHFIPSFRPGTGEERLQSVDTIREDLAPPNLLGRLPQEFSGKLLGERTVTLAKGETLFERGDAGDGCYWLRRGVVTVCAISAGAYSGGV